MTPEAEELQPIDDWPMPTREVLRMLQRGPACGSIEPAEPTQHADPSA
jgi:hypothetical protein